MHSPEPSAQSPEPDARWWLYLLACKHGRTYAGVAIDVEARFAKHVSGKGARFTRANPPLAILAAQAFADRSEAQRAEHALKRLTPVQKLEWARAHAWREKKMTSTGSTGDTGRREEKVDLHGAHGAHGADERES